MTEAEAVAAIAGGNASQGVQVLTSNFNWRWVPGSHTSGWSGPGAPFGYQRFTVDGIGSLVTNQRAFELQGGTTGSVSDLLSLLNDSVGGVAPPGEPPQTITSPEAQGEDPAGQPFHAPVGVLNGAGWVWLVLLAVVLLED